MVVSALASMLPLVIWWRRFTLLFFFHDDWELLQGASTNALAPWLFQPFVERADYSVIQIPLDRDRVVLGGSYLAMMVLLWATHFAILLLFGWLLLRLGLSAPASAIAVVTLGLPWSNLETLGWAMQWSALLAILFLLIAWHILLGILDGRRWLPSYVLCLLASGLVCTRGIFYGAVLAAFRIWSSPRPSKRDG